MNLFLTSILPFLAHNHASAAAFLTCRHHNFHSSIIPEFLSDEDGFYQFCEVWQQNQRQLLISLEPQGDKQYTKLCNLFVQTPLMQFSPSLVLSQNCVESIVKALLETKYFTRTLQRCYVDSPFTNDLLRDLSKVRSLTKLGLNCSEVENQHLEIIVNSFPSLETLTIYQSTQLKIVDPSQPAINVTSSR